MKGNSGIWIDWKSMAVETNIGIRRALFSVLWRLLTIIAVR